MISACCMAMILSWERHANPNCIKTESELNFTAQARPRHPFATVSRAALACQNSNFWHIGLERAGILWSAQMTLHRSIRNFSIS
jgi:hypothetical protein